MYKVLRFPKGALVTRYLHLSLVFLFSGLLQEFFDIVGGLPYPGQIYYFMTQVLGIILKDAVQAIYHAARGV